MTLGGAVLLATAVACVRGRPAVVERRVAPPLKATAPDSGENGLDRRWRLFCDLLEPRDGGLLVDDWGGRVACQNHVVSLVPGDAGAPRSWRVKPLLPEFEAFAEYMRACRSLGWDIGLEGVIDECRVICVNRELALVTSLDGGACGHGESWMRADRDPRSRMGDYAPFGPPWDEGAPVRPTP